MQRIGVWLATWMLVGQVTMPQGTVTQEVRAFPSVEACEQTRQQGVAVQERQVGQRKPLPGGGAVELAVVYGVLTDQRELVLTDA